MGKVINEHKISVTLITAVLCALFIFKVSFSLGADQAKVKDNVQVNTDTIVKLNLTCEQRAVEQSKINREVSKSLIEIKSDLKYIKKHVEKD